MKQQPKNRKQLLDIGIAGPLVGFVVSIVVLFIGLKLSKLDTLPTSFPTNMGLQIEGNSIIYLLLKYLAFGKLLPEPTQFWISPTLHWLRYFFTATPFPLGGTDVMLSPVAWAGWAGLLVTSLNLIPAGQLDGGHIFFVLFGRKTARKLRPIVLILLVMLGLVWIGWWIWALLIFFMGRVYAEPLDEITPLDKRRKILGIIALIVFLLTLTPVPLSLITGG
jgi:membrane-associated protease RseP (regulator of RpoE activity)